MTITPLIRVERGHAGLEELAALTALLLTRVHPTPTHPTITHRHHHERTPAFPIPHSWRLMT
ncbi:acyl-CoA carboxylase epsilon subunit [Streptomyces sp. ST2-7A]|uniref:acyl-CoA carboxylase epsilon subunit n=1 Tax=Streptomyces sp. ST2-7A TaxID=2907214 RepID=UPI001F356213|nr:acyl-CoA carboxylase epsilon subunit [Streptomyces sp. ST2-7A]MCE7080617.1 acyl-CoA carboxylase subunit epsilon [Streptomyces sp. ST2-7A]